MTDKHRGYQGMDGQGRREFPFKWKGKGNRKAARDAWNNDDTRDPLSIGSRTSTAAGGAGASSWQLSGDLAVKDAVLPPAPRRITRDQLDRQTCDRFRNAATTSQNLSKICSAGSPPGSLSTLTRSCLRVVSQNITDNRILDKLAEGDTAQTILDIVVARLRRDYGQELPFSAWKRLVQTYDTLPLAFKAYKGIVFDDESHLRNLHLFDAPFSFTPSFNIVTVLDLSDTAFTKENMWRIRANLCSSLVALRLNDIVLLDDDSITALTRDAGDQGVFQKLEILSLRGCFRLTDKCAAKFAGFPSLQLLGT